MRKLSKLKLPQNAELMNEDEMKMIVGGYTDNDCGVNIISCDTSKYCIESGWLGKCGYVKISDRYYCACIVG